ENRDNRENRDPDFRRPDKRQQQPQDKTFEFEGIISASGVLEIMPECGLFSGLFVLPGFPMRRLPADRGSCR
ncbi:MAG TPA: hypothetical protein ENI20_15410, partial [Bacteroides sp.]|nr:hypothetical protein [Bacteroides sp.]